MQGALYSFFGLPFCSTGYSFSLPFWIKKLRSKNLRTSSIILVMFVSKHLFHKGSKQNSHDGRTNRHDGLPLITIKRDNVEEALQEGKIKQGKVQSHGQANGIDENHVLP